MKVFKKLFVVLALLIASNLQLKAQVQGDCDCTTDENTQIVCVDFGDDLVLPLSLCEYNCLSAADESFDFPIVDCPDGTDNWFNNPNDSIDFPIDEMGDDFPGCDCTGDEEMDLCVDFGDGFVLPMSTCQFDCYYAVDSSITIVDCDGVDLTDWFNNPNDSIDFPIDEMGDDFPGCDCTGDEEMDLCVDFGDGFVLPMSTCQFDCLTSFGIPVIAVDCDDDSGEGYYDGNNGNNNQTLFGITELEDLELYPNPVTDYNLTVEFIASGDTQASVNIFNLFGQIVYVENVSLHNGGNQLKINTANLEKGFYTISIQPLNGKAVTQTLIKE